MQAYPKRLIEVDLPIKRISAHARREKSIRHGHISTLHIWWARRPLAACRAVICAALWPDPADPLAPKSFRMLQSEQCDAAAGANEIMLGKLSAGKLSQRVHCAFQKYPERLTTMERTARRTSRFHCRLCQLGQFDCSRISRHQPRAHTSRARSPGRRTWHPAARGGPVCRGRLDSA